MTDFIDTFNQRLGSRTGKPIKAPSPIVFEQNKEASELLRKRKMLMDVLSQRANERQSKSGSTDSGESFEPVFGNLTQPAVDLITDNPAEEIKGGGGGFWDNPVTNALGNAASKAAGVPSASDLLDVGSRALDIISRPAYGAFEGLKEASESLNEGQSPVGSIDDVIGGVWSGLSGQEKTGFGEFIEENANRDNFSLPGWTYAAAPLLAFGEGLNNDETPEWLNKWGKRGLGLSGELLLDPLNYVGVGLVGKVGKGANYTSDAFKAMTRSKVDDAISEILPDVKSILNTRKLEVIPNAVGPKGGKLTANRNAYDRIGDLTDDIIDRTMLQVNPRGKSQAAGRVLGGEIGPAAISSNVAEGLRKETFSAFDNHLAEFTEHMLGTGTRMSTQRIKTLRRSDKFFDNFIEELTKISNVRRSKNKIKSEDIFDALEDSLNRGGISPRTARNRINVAASNTKNSLEDSFREVQEKLYKELSGEIYNAPGIRVGRNVKSVPGLDRLGRAYSGVRANKLSGDAAKGFSTARAMPGRTGLMNQRLRSLGIRKYEQFHETVNAVAKDITPNEAKQITENILKDIPFTDPRLEKARLFIKDEYKRMYNEELDAGVRSLSSSPMADNYVYNFYKKGKRSEVTRFKDRARSATRANNRIPESVVKEAKEQGLKPEEDAFRALLMRQMKSNRKLSNSWLTRDLLDHYGVKANRLGRDEAKARKLNRMSRNLTEDIKQEMKEGDEWFLPDDIHDVYQAFQKMNTMGYNQDTAALVRTIDKLTRMFKSSATVYYPGFHIRNSIGDIFMSHLDGVRAHDYQWLMDFKNRDVRLRRGRQGPGFARTKIGDREFSYEELKDIFRKNASSGGFYNTDLGTEQIFSKVKPNRINQGIRGLSENREDFFRMSHFMKAFKEEYPNALKQTKNADQALKNAIETSTYRVNKSLFDYGALTPFEKTFMRRAIPFYTYQRKVMPTLIESLLLKPQQLAKTNRMFLDSNRPGDNFDDMLLADYQREYGYAKLNDEDEPWILGAQFLPTNSLLELGNFKDSGEWLRNIGSQGNPLWKAPGEKL